MTHDDLFQKLLGNHSRSWCGDIFFWVSNNNFLRRFLITDIGEDRSEYFPDPGITIFFSLETGLSSTWSITLFHTFVALYTKWRFDKSKLNWPTRIV